MAIPTVFISYTWDSDTHKQWVLELATRLRGSGVEVILDRWHLNIGMDRLRFMEQAVAQSERVLLIGTANFATKASQRKGGVGWEASVITAELADDLSQAKFIPILREGEFSSSFPSWLKSRIGADLRGDPYSKDAFNTLLQELHDEALAPPPVGPKPSFSTSVRRPAGRPFTRTEPKDGAGRFRSKGEPIGIRWDQLPFVTETKKITLADGPTMWLRVLPQLDTEKTWPATELKKAGTQDGSWLLPFFGSEFRSVRADDGYGLYSSFDPAQESAYTVAFAFEHGEVWSVDTHLLAHGGELYVGEMFKEFVDKLPQYASFLRRLGIPGPYTWEAGLQGIDGMKLMRPAEHQFFQRAVCLASTVSSSGEFTPGDDANAVLYPLLKKLYEKSGLAAPTMPQVGQHPTLNQPPRQNAVAYSFFDRSGSSEQVKLYVRPTEKSGVYSLESDPGGEVRGTESEIADLYAQRVREYERAGFKRMTAMNGTGSREFD